ncbi:M36 family metallopeptidase [Actinoplanes sp. NPDC051470]|uniref:M36 family metallopeptidase n=1 Tax=Actinoplanes sp. NPDC051470 TaxID=3157224 RepID=UPI00344A5FA6
MRRRTRVYGAGLLAATMVLGGAPAVVAAPAGVTGDAYAYVDNRPPAAGKRAPVALFRPDGPLATGLSKDPDQAARQYLTGNAALFGGVGELDTIARSPIGGGTVVLLRQRFGSLPAAHEGLAAVAVRDGDVLRVTSSLSPRAEAPAPARLTADQALTAALADAGIPRDRLASHRVRLVAMPMPGAAARAAYQTVIISADDERPLAYTTYVDAIDGRVLVRENLVDFADDDPHWKVFPAGSPARSELWCTVAAAGCDRVVQDPATGSHWDADPATGQPTLTSRGNSAETVRAWGNGTPETYAPERADREYDYPFTNQWAESRCDPAALTSPERIDADAATANLFAMHNRLHDWAYHLGFTEATWNLQRVNTRPGGLGGDPERGNAQQGAATATTRNNANQTSPPDGVQPVTNLFLFQPTAGAIYAPCVDSAFDMTFIAHEYAHTISNRMIAGPDTRLNSSQGNAMGESWSDLIAMEFLYEHGLTPPGNSPFVIGGYLSDEPVSGVRNYDMSDSPLNFSQIGYDPSTNPHPVGEIWSATNAAIRQAMIDRYGAGDRASQESCAAGTTPVEECPGNRRWIQLVLDSFLLQANGDPSMVDMRDNLIAADRLRFGGADEDLLWTVFASRGLGADAVSGPNDVDPAPSFRSPLGGNARVTFRPATDRPAKLYVGDYEYGAVPVADTDPATALPDTVSMVPGEYRFLAAGPGLGHARFTSTVGGDVTLDPALGPNLASTAAGATVTSPHGSQPQLLTDDNERTVWTATGGAAGRIATVDLPGTESHLIARLQLSAVGATFTAVRSFEILACDATTGADCATDNGFQPIYRSPDDAFPAARFRPKAPQLTLKSFAIPPTPATHLRLRTLTSQCTGTPFYAGEQDNDPRAATDCSTTSAQRGTITLAEFEAFTAP